MKTLIGMVALFALIGCEDRDEKVQDANRERDRVECAKHGALFFEDGWGKRTCFAIDSIVPLTGPRDSIVVGGPE